MDFENVGERERLIKLLRLKLNGLILIIAIFQVKTEIDKCKIIQKKAFTNTQQRIAKKIKIG